MKVYVVTSGCYSDYSIRRVFSNKIKAEIYAKGIRDANDLEEYELDDDKEIKIYTSIYIVYCIEKADFEIVQLNQTNSLDNPFEKANRDSYMNYGNHTTFILQRGLPEIVLTDKKKEYYKIKYKKVIYDLVAQIQYLKEHDGFNEKQINEWLKNK